MAKNQKPIDKTDIQFIKVETTNLPTYKENRVLGIFDWGKKNNYPSELISLADNHPIHGAIVKGKTRYLVGLDLKAEIVSPIVEQFLKRANDKESWFELSKKSKRRQGIVWWLLYFSKNKHSRTAFVVASLGYGPCQD